jgi:mannose-1-phosphate guanylyltransferase/mannose-6-phosphate isomerase
MNIYPVILSGGSGTRLWPLSRELSPKQLLPLVEQRTMLQETVRRLDGLPNGKEPVIVCNEEHRFLVAEQMRQLGKSSSSIILESLGRNTAPALTLAALALVQNAEDGVMLVMPADHVIQDSLAFHAVVQQGAALAQEGSLVTFGIVPTQAETGYGYIKKGASIAATGTNAMAETHADRTSGAWQVAAFVEKPDAATAQRYLDSGEHLWNSGMFMMRASVWLAELAASRADIEQACRGAYTGGTQDGDFFRVEKSAFAACPSDSIDYAVMEKTAKAVVLALDAGWSDVGAWSALWQVRARDADGNVIQGDVHTHATHNTLLISQHRFLAAVGVQDLVIVETADAVLVAHKDSAQDVKKIVEHLKKNNRDEYKNQRKVYRPWGCYEGVDAGPRFQVKRITVTPGASLSLQMHHHRAEHWIIVKGTARVTRGEEVFILSENQSTYIPLGTKHRLENPGSIPLEMIEVQSGGYLGEDDIVRFEDKYNRHNN